MKTFIALFFTLFLGVAVFAQTPQSFRYQAVARDNSGNVLANQAVSFRISILSSSVSGTVAYTETHTGLSTNAFGLVELEIGKGTPVTGTLSAINWGGNIFFVKIEIDPVGGLAYQTLSTSQLLSVPYALHAKTVEQISDHSVTGSKLAPMDATNGQALKWNGTTWAPSDDNGSLWQQSGNNIYYNNGYAGIGTSSPQKQLHINTWDVFSGILMTNDASGTTLDDGLHIGLQYQGDAPNNRYALILNRENSKLIIGTNNNNAGDLTILPGGNTGLGTSTPSARLDVNGHIRIRDGSSGTGKVLTSDAVGLASWQPVAISVDGNNFSGDGSSASPLKMKQMGASNGQVLKWNGSMWWPYNDNAGISLPYFEQCSTNVGFVINNEQGIAIEGLAASTANTGTGTGVMGESRMDYGTGVYALASSTGSGTTYALRAESRSSNGFGLRAAATHTTGYNYGVWGSSASSQGHGIIGENSSSTGTTYGVRGIVTSSGGFSGHFSGGKFHVTGRVGLGTESPAAGLHLKGTGFPGSFMYIEANTGQDAGFRLYEGTTEKWHIFNNSTAGGLTINNNAYTIALFAKQSNAYVGLGTSDPSQKLDVNGNARFRSIGSGAYSGVVNRTADGTLTTATSDVRLKENINTLKGGLDKVMQLRGVSFNWKSNPEYGTRIGFIAQEFEKVIPELVFTNDVDGYKGINYAEVTAVLVEALKELKTENDKLKAENEKVNTRLEKIEAWLNSTVKD